MTSRATRVDPLREVGIVVEGQTEGRFVSEVLAPFLREHGIYTKTVIVKTSMVPVAPPDVEAVAGGITGRTSSVFWARRSSRA